ncbi:serine/threonine-protein kinase pim-3-like [Macrobrachium nipponense]|uniref:serine/threonine-protein kinase pim-3-like n=1 Tax=Macrobrachium nipponense TaxID=159736 RepID=UPI0030C7BD5A
MKITALEGAALNKSAEHDAQLLEEMEKLRFEVKQPKADTSNDSPRNGRKKKTYRDVAISFTDRETLLKDVEVIKTLGEGGNGKVDLVSFNDTVCVLKTALGGRVPVKELRIMSYLDGAGGAPKIIAASEKEFLCTYSGARTLRDFIKDVTVSQECLLRDIAQVSERVREVHEKSIVHNDIKEDNVVYDEPNRTFNLIDFGLSTHVGESLATVDDPDEFKRLDWMAPEVKRGEGATPRSDVFSLGVLLGNAIFQFRHPNAVALTLVGWATSEAVMERPSLEEFIAVMKGALKARHYAERALKFFEMYD